MSINDFQLNELLSILQKKKREANRFIDKYKTRNMTKLEEYYKGVSWALDFIIKKIKEQIEKKEK